MKYYFVLVFLVICNIAFTDESKYIPLCSNIGEHKCVDKYNIAYVTSGTGIVNGIPQTLYGVGYMRIIPTLGHDNLVLGGNIQGCDKNGIYGAQVSIGINF